LLLLNAAVMPSLPFVTGPDVRLLDPVIA